jgi:hypothetical protein
MTRNVRLDTAAQARTIPGGKRERRTTMTDHARWHSDLRTRLELISIACEIERAKIAVEYHDRNIQAIGGFLLVLFAVCTLGLSLIWPCNRPWNEASRDRFI